MQYRPYYFKLSVRWYRAYSGIEQSFQSHFVISHSIFIYLLYKYIYKYINILYLYYVNIKRYSHCPQTQSITVILFRCRSLLIYIFGRKSKTYFWQNLQFPQSQRPRFSLSMRASYYNIAILYFS
jgi:hypothetical protein